MKPTHLQLLDAVVKIIKAKIEAKEPITLRLASIIGAEARARLVLKTNGHIPPGEYEYLLTFVEESITPRVKLTPGWSEAWGGQSV